MMRHRLKQLLTTVALLVALQLSPFVLWSTAAAAAEPLAPRAAVEERRAVVETTAEDAKDYRAAVMTTLRGHIRAASMHVRGLVDDHGFLAKHAEGLANGLAELKHLFAAGSNVGDSEALPVIWEEPEEFAKAIERSEKATQAFSAAVESGDQAAIGAAFRDVGRSCKGCHNRFRAD